MTTSEPVDQRRPSRRRGDGRLVAGLLAVACSLLTGCEPTTVTSAAHPPNIDSTDAVQVALRAGKPTVVEFGANACASCREMRPILEALQRDHGDQITVLNVDIVKSRDYITRYRIQLMPTQVFYDAKGREIGRNMGAIAGSQVLARLGVGADTRSR